MKLSANNFLIFCKKSGVSVIIFIISYVIQNFSFQKTVLTPRIVNFIIIKNFNLFFFFLQQNLSLASYRSNPLSKYLFFFNSYDYFFTLKYSRILDRSSNLLTYYSNSNTDSLRY